jgi:hypothetical protein
MNDKFTSSEEANRLALIHHKNGDRLSYPQLEEWDIYQGDKYCIRVFPVGYNLHHGSYLCTANPVKEKEQVIQWTPHKDVAEDIVARSKKCGWKYKDTVYEILVKGWLKEHGYKASTFAGFNVLVIVRDGEEVIVIPQSDVVKEFIKG